MESLSVKEETPPAAGPLHLLFPMSIMLLPVQPGFASWSMLVNLAGAE